FAPNSSVTILLDGQAVPGGLSLTSDARGLVEETLTVTSDWSIGSHTLTAQDGQGNRTQQSAALEIVHQGEAGTPGPNGAPSDNAAFNILVTIDATDTGTGEQTTITITLNVSNGRVCDDEDDTGQPQTKDWRIYDVNDGHTLGQATETYTLTCSGTY